LSPSAVHVRMQNRNPIVTLDGSYVVTADGNSAARHNVTQMELAQQWADSIRHCMADSGAFKNYMSMLTGRNKTANTIVSTREQIAVLTSDTLLPINMGTDLLSDIVNIGDGVQAVISHDVPLGPTFDAYLPAGTIAF